MRLWGAWTLELTILKTSPYLPFSLLLGFLFAAVPWSFSSAQSSAHGWVTKAADWQKLKAGKTIFLNTPEEALKSKPTETAAILVDSPPHEVWAVIADKEGAPKFIKGLKSAKVLKRGPGYELVEQKMTVGLIKVTYVLKDVSEPPDTVKFSRHSGDMKEIDGFWKFYPVDGGTQTLVVYRLGLKPGMGIPDLFVHSSLKTSLPEALRDVKGEVARRRAHDPESSKKPSVLKPLKSHK